MADANVLRTIFTYSLNGLGPYPIAFDYLARKFVQVTLLGADRKLLVLGTDYRFVSTTSIQLLKAAPAGYNQIEVRRYTSAQDRLVDFQDGSILRATDLNVSQVQTMHIAEEGRDVAGNTLGVDSGGNLDARLRKMVNLLDGVLEGDAVTIRQMKSWSESALNQATVAKQQADLAITAASGAKTSETNSKTSETNSKTSENLAKDWASKPQGQLVDATKYSALHYSLNSESSANQSTQMASASAQSADKAKTSETNSANSASGAAVDANRAKTEADRAASANPDNQLKKANNLSDVANVDTARANLRALGVDDSINTPWITPTMINDWSISGANLVRTGYRKVNGMVQLTLNVGTNRSHPDGQALLVLPVGFRPAFIMSFMNMVERGQPGREGFFSGIDINPDGTVTSQGFTGSARYLRVHVMFPLE